MPLKPKHKRLINVILLLACLFTGITVLAITFRDNLVYYYSPTDLNRIETTEPDHFKKITAKKMRIGGLVKEGSINKIDALNIKFTLTDQNSDINVSFKGIIPPLFRELQGIVAEGKLILNDDGSKNFIADNLLTKHDENYMPPEVAASLKNKIHDANQQVK